MYLLLISIIVGLFVAMLFVNIYFRVKVLKAYKILIQNKVEFKASHVFNKKSMEAEILPKYPGQRQAILDFANHIRYSIKMATVLAVLITAMGAVLMIYGRA